MILPDGTTINHTQLRDELAAASIVVSGFLEVDGTLLTFDADGEPTDLTPEAVAIVAAHKAEPLPPDPIERAIAAVELAKTLPEMRAAMVAALQSQRPSVRTE